MPEALAIGQQLAYADTIASRSQAFLTDVKGYSPIESKAHLSTHWSLPLVLPGQLVLGLNKARLGLWDENELPPPVRGQGLAVSVTAGIGKLCVAKFVPAYSRCRTAVYMFYDAQLAPAFPL